MGDVPVSRHLQPVLVDQAPSVKPTKEIERWLSGKQNADYKKQAKMLLPSIG